jgi:DNA-binding MarR family transcriptional regulator
MRARVSTAEYRALAGFRQVLRSFLRFSETAAQAAGLTARQHQALLAIRGAARPPTIQDLATALGVRHHSAVGLVDRLATLRLVARHPSPVDGRQVLLTLTGRGARRLEGLAAAHRRELRQITPRLKSLLERLARPVPERHRIRIRLPAHVSAERP